VVGTDVPGVHVGDHLTVRMYAPAALESAMTGGSIPAQPDGPAQDVTVVGVVKDSLTGSGVQLSQAFVDRYRDALLVPDTYVNAAVRLRGGAGDIQTFQQHLIDLTLTGNKWTGSFLAHSIDKPRGFTLEASAESVAARQTRMKDPEAVFEFSCASPTGEVVRNTHFEGKALIVDIMGTGIRSFYVHDPDGVPVELLQAPS